MRLTTLTLGASLAVLVGCSEASEEGPRAEGVTAEVDDSIATVVHVRWKTSGETRGRVWCTRPLGVPRSDGFSVGT